MIEVYIHIQRFEDLIAGNPVNVKFNYADQYDLKLLINPKHYNITFTKDARNLMTIRKKKFLFFMRRGL